MIQVQPSVNAAQLEKELGVNEEDLQRPLKFYMERLLKDELMRRELLFRLRDSVKDAAIRDLIDKCLESTQSQVEREKEHQRVQFHQQMKTLKERIDKAILKIEEGRRQNEIIESNIRKVAQALSRDSKQPVEEINAIRQEIARLVEANVKRKKEYDDVMQTLHARLREESYAPMEQREQYLQKQKALKQMSVEEANKKAELEELNKTISTLNRKEFEVDLALEKQRRSSEPIDILKEKPLADKILSFRQAKPKTYFIGQRDSDGGDFKYKLLLVFTLFVWAVILSFKAYRTINDS